MLDRKPVFFLLRWNYTNKPKLFPTAYAWACVGSNIHGLVYPSFEMDTSPRVVT